MANEIKVSASMSVANGNLAFSQSFGKKSYDQAAVGGPSPGMVSVGTTEESVGLSELTAPGWVTMQNLDDTNFVDWGFSTGVYGGRLQPGETAGPFRLAPSAALYVKADTAACRVVVNALES